MDRHLLILDGLFAIAAECPGNGHGALGVLFACVAGGTLVVLNYGGRFTVARVVDRGPYVKGRYWDLTAATARALGVDGVATVRSHS